MTIMASALSNGSHTRWRGSSRGEPSSKSVVFPSVGKTAYRFAPGGGSVYTCKCIRGRGLTRGLCGTPALCVTHERFYRTSRCNREACVIFLSIPFFSVELFTLNCFSFQIAFFFKFKTNWLYSIFELWLLLPRIWSQLCYTLLSAV